MAHPFRCYAYTNCYLNKIEMKSRKKSQDFIIGGGEQKRTIEKKPKM